MDTSSWILFTLQDNKRVVINANAIESIDEMTPKKTQITTRHTTIEVLMSFDEVIKVIESLANQTHTQIRKQTHGELTQNP